MNPDAIRCPRCDETMETFSRRGAGGASVLADMCNGCGGLWLDGKEVAAVVPAFAGLVDRVAASPAPAVPSAASIPMCPRCSGVARPFRFFELLLDVCLECHGLWVDGEELTDLARTADRAEGLPAPAPREPGYRENAALAASSQRVPCRACAVELPLRAVEATSRGPMCAACARALREEKMDAAMADYEPPTDALFDLSFFGDVVRALPVFLGVALSAHGTCARCGCRSASRCSH